MDPLLILEVVNLLLYVPMAYLVWASGSAEELVRMAQARGRWPSRRHVPEPPAVNEAVMEVIRGRR